MHKALKAARVYTRPVCIYLGVCEYRASMVLTTEYTNSAAEPTVELACVYHAGAMVVNRLRSPLVTKVTTTRKGEWKA